MAIDPAAVEAVEIAKKAAAAGDDYEWRALQSLRDYPVSIGQFITDPAYLGSSAVYPAILNELIKLNNPRYSGCEYRSRIWTVYTEAVLTGGIGSGKSTLALYSLAYQIYVLSCFRNPHTLYELDPASEILFVVQNKTERLAKAVDYDRLNSMLATSSYFRERFPFDRRIKSELRFPNRIVVKPVAGTGDAVIGQNVFSAMVDEINYMDTVERSRRSADGDQYDQAMTLYLSIARRRASRFLRRGRLPGLLLLVSSRRYPGQFTDRKEAERRRQLAETGYTNIYLFDKRVWEIKPPGTYSGETFSVFIGDESRKPRILDPREKITQDDKSLVMAVPIEHQREFENDILNALRDIAGVSTLALRPFLVNRNAVAACFDLVDTIISRPDCDFEATTLQISQDLFVKPRLIRWAHLDLALTGDAAGVVVGHVAGFDRIKRGSTTEILPRIHIDLVLQVLPPKGGEIRFDRIRAVLYMLRDLGMDLRFVTADSFQSADTLQQLRLKGFFTGRQSIDKDPRPYELLKSTIYDGRLELPQHDTLKRELLALELDPKTGRVDHPVRGSKDCADALAGVVYGLSMRRDVWHQHGVDPYQSAPKFANKFRSTSDNRHGNSGSQ